MLSAAARLRQAFSSARVFRSRASFSRSYSIDFQFARGLLDFQGDLLLLGGHQFDVVADAPHPDIDSLAREVQIAAEGVGKTLAC